MPKVLSIDWNLHPSVIFSSFCPICWMHLRAELILENCVNGFVDIKTKGMKHYFNKNSLYKLKYKCPKLPSWIQMLNC